MKLQFKILLVCFLFSNLISNSQIVLQNTFNFEASTTELSTNLNKIYVVDNINNRCLIYNFDYTIWKTINLTVPAGEYIYEIKFVSQYLFNKTDDVEVLYINRKYVEISPTSYYYIYTANVITESGQILVQIPNSYSCEIKSDDSENFKLIALASDFSVFPYSITSYFYSIPGKMDKQIEPAKKEFLAFPFPNPAQSEISLPYILPDTTQTAELIIVDMQGKVIKTAEVNGQLNQYKLNIESFREGIYSYYINSGIKNSENRKFIVLKK